HKVTGVSAGLGETFGIDALDLLRPEKPEQLFYGPLEDAVRPGESFSPFPIYKDSRYCGSCHEGTVFGVRVYATYSEWRESAAAARGVHCQQCHMAPSGMTNVAPGKGGIERDPRTLGSHAFPGARDLLAESLDLTVHARRGPSGVEVEA